MIERHCTTWHGFSLLSNSMRFGSFVCAYASISSPHCSFSLSFVRAHSQSTHVQKSSRARKNRPISLACYLAACTVIAMLVCVYVHVCILRGWKPFLFDMWTSENTLLLFASSPSSSSSSSFSLLLLNVWMHTGQCQAQAQAYNALAQIERINEQQNAGMDFYMCRCAVYLRFQPNYFARILRLEHRVLYCTVP